MQTLAHYLSRYRSLSRRQKKVLWGSFILLPLFWLGLRLFGLQRFQGWLQKFPVADCQPMNADEAAAIGVAVNIAANHAPGPVTCLTRSLLLCSLLRRFGTQSELKIGVRIIDGELAAHAWVEMDGLPINDAPDVVSHYVAFDRPLSSNRFS